MEKNLITVTLPMQQIVEVNKRKVKLDIASDTKTAIKALMVLSDPEINEEVKKVTVCKLVFPILDDVTRKRTDILYPLALEFLKGCPTPEYQKANIPTSGEPLMYLNADSQAIVAAFRGAYGIGLKELQALHWWETKALLNYLPSETRLSSMIAIRNEPLKGDDKDIHRKREAKKSVKPIDKRSAAEKEAEAMSAFASLL